MGAQMFSEAWHRVAASRAQLNPAAEVSRQTFRGEIWYVIRDPFSNRFFRLQSSAWNFLARLRTDRTIDQVWRECLELFPGDSPGQQDVIRLLAQLTEANLMVSDLPPDAGKLYERRRKADEKELGSKWLNFLFLRMHLLDPNPFLERLLPWFRPFFSRWFFVVWLLLVLNGVKLALEHWDAVRDQSQAIFSPSNFFLFYFCGVLTKFWHELGHALVCKRYGGEVRTFGVMLMILTPLPYVDVSSSTGFTDSRRRMLVAAAGMIFEFFLAALAMLVWASTGPGMINSMAYNIVVLASVTTLLFNINPLLRFDGYYIFSDWVQIPNLGQRSTLHLKYLLEHYVFRSRFAVGVARSPAEARWLGVYGVTSGLYRIVLLWSIFFVLAEHFLGLGLVLAAVTVVLWVVVPSVRFVRYILHDPVLEAVRSRAITLTFGGLAVILVFLWLIPFPNHFRADGVVEASRYARIFAESEGRVEKIVVPSGEVVHKGDLLMVLSNPQLDCDIEAANAQVRECEARLQGVTMEARVELQPAESEMDAARGNLKRAESLKSRLEIRAPFDGVWAAPGVQDTLGAWMQRGNQLGEVIDPAAYRFVAVVSQQQASELFSKRLRGGKVRLRGQSGTALPARQFRIVPAEQKILPSAALGWSAGGDVKTEKNDASGLKAEDPFFLVYADLQARPGIALMQRRTGVLRFDLKWEPLLSQWSRSLRQVFQEKIRN
ncbi:MAG: biotin/lipoyl-binding protein [Methylacidiphilales bacterium]|nr:biotin/lipoyl-binding protein [Candidatus Methylacidiphilales bacterium]